MSSNLDSETLVSNNDIAPDPLFSFPHVTEGRPTKSEFRFFQRDQKQKKQRDKAGV